MAGLHNMCSRVGSILSILLTCNCVICLGIDPLRELSCEIIFPKQLSADGEQLTEAQRFLIPFAGKSHVVSLNKQMFLPIDFRIFVDNKEERNLSRYILGINDCYFQGLIVDLEKSLVTMRTCFGLRGFLENGENSFIIAPIELLTGFKHFLCKMGKDFNDPHIIADNDTDPASQKYQQHLLTKSRPGTQYVASVFGTTRYLKLSIFVTVEVYEALGGDPLHVNLYFVQFVSYLNTKFYSLNLQVFLSHLDLWTASNLSPQKKILMDTLEVFVNWLSRIPVHLKNYDIPLLVVAGDSEEVGKTYFGKLCSQSNGAIVTFPNEIHLEKFASLAAHILGHNLGMLHDNARDCKCPDVTCIMDKNLMASANTNRFSSCSLQDFETFIIRTGATCLLSLPSMCGNKMLDHGEECDCGAEPDCENNPCCNYKTCSFKPGAKCTNGPCCADCQFLPAGTLCRAAANECDLPEFCSETVRDCPEDVYQQNGNPCNQDKSICYNGMCHDADEQCKHIFGAASKSADSECYKETNMLGDRFGSCGGIPGSYTKCYLADVLCGKIQCVMTGAEPITNVNASLIYYFPKSTVCVTADYSTTDWFESAWVKDGTKCGENKVCLNQKCRNISLSELRCNRETNCNDHGVCNNKHNCHCDMGWRPPSCIEQGTGGSINSGVMTKQIDMSEKSNNGTMDSYSRNWLIIGLCLILPLFVLVVSTVAKRHSIQRSCQKEDYEEDETETESESGDQVSLSSITVTE